MTKVMKTLSVLGLSAAVAGSVMAFNPAPAEAGSAGKVAAGIAAGVAIGIIANEAAHAHERNHQPQRIICQTTDNSVCTVKRRGSRYAEFPFRQCLQLS